jgi:outer membrane protein assembly factor BamB
MTAMHTLMRSKVAMIVVHAWLAGAASASDWPQFRGRDAGTAADDPRLPDTWSATENVLWRLDVPGTGWSSPVVTGNHVFLTAVVAEASEMEAAKPGLYNGGVVTEVSKAVHRWIVYDVDLQTGRIRWEREVKRSTPNAPKHQKASYASETPVTDGERVYAYFGGMGLYVFDLGGRALWSKALGPFKTRNGWGTGTSPIVHKGRVYLVCDNEEQSFMVAFDARTGKEIWRLNREEPTNWSTPFVWEHERGAELVTAGTGRIRSYDLDGRILWELAGMSSITIPTPFTRHGLLYVSSGYLGDNLRPTYAIKPGARGDITLKPGETSNAFVAWSEPTIASYNPTPLVYGDHLYTLLDRGFVTCHEAKTGREVYGRQRVAVDATGFTSSPWAYNGKVFLLSEDGNTYVMQAGTEFKMVGRNDLNEMTLATPAVADGSLLIRTASKLYRFRRAAGASAR